MATVVDATCSECSMPQQIEISPRFSQIYCDNCGHTTPMMDKKEMASLRGVITAERSKMYIVLACVGGAAFFMALFVLWNLRDPTVTVQTQTEEITGRLVSRDAYAVTVRTATGAQERLQFETLFGTQVDAHMRANPHLSRRDAAAALASKAVTITMPETATVTKILFLFAAVAGLAGLVFAYISSQEYTVLEF